MWRELLFAGVFGASVCAGVASATPVVEASGESARHAARTERGAERRIALVIGNARYEADPLSNPARDALAVARSLRAYGFDVDLRVDLDAGEMAAAVGDFHARLREGGVGLFYFAGHGYRVGEDTLLAPIDVGRGAPATLVTKGVALAQVLGGMAATRPGGANLVILDTCQNSPFAGPIAAPRALPRDTLVAYAAAPGTTAADGREHGVFTAALLDAFAVPGRDAADALRSAADAVARETRREQEPVVSSTLSRAPRFDIPEPARAATPRSPRLRLAAAGSDAAPRARGILPKDSEEQYELTFWESIKDSEYASDYEAYLKAYPNGRFAALARARAERLRAAAQKAAPPPAKAETPAPKSETPAPKPAAPAKVETPAPKPAPAERKVETAPPRPAAVAAPASVGAPGREIRDCPSCPVLVELPPGTFVMGSNTDDPSERPAHRVSIRQAFAIGKYEVTNEQWDACVAANACAKLSGEGAKNAPVRDVSWDDARRYVAWLAKTTGKSYRLPTEAEWEYAARAGTSTRYWWGAQFVTGKANCKDCGKPWREDEPNEVGSFAPNPYGLHDMNGGVWEWVADCWHTSYRGAPSDGSAWDEPDCRTRVIRGGSWRDGADYMLSSTRFKYGASVRQSQNGFRVARDAP